jgi:hypothetical protein
MFNYATMRDIDIVMIHTQPTTVAVRSKAPNLLNRSNVFNPTRSMDVCPQKKRAC